MLNSDYRDILSALCDAKAEFLVVGAYALASHGLVRATSDIDIWVNPTVQNAERVVNALLEFGAPLEQIEPSAFTAEDQVVQLGIAPVRVDLLTGLTGLTFVEAWERREQVTLEGIEVPVLCLKDLATNKRATGRPQDLADLKWIEEREL